MSRPPEEHFVELLAGCRVVLGFAALALALMAAGLVWRILR